MAKFSDHQQLMSFMIHEGYSKRDEDYTLLKLFMDI
jgi:hypothetical protein